jgi:hydroxyacylglutathione hydrolase
MNSPPVTRPTRLSDPITWWPSTLYQTTTLELTKGQERLLIDPGVSPWEIREVSQGAVDRIILTHGDWDHVLGVGMLDGAEVTASRATAERLSDALASEDIGTHAAHYYIPVEALSGLRVDRLVDPPARVQLGPWTAAFTPAPGHTNDSMSIFFPEERLLVVGDYLSELEIPFVNSSTFDYRDTLARFVAAIETDAPEHVVVGHGQPHTADRALELALEDIKYIDSLIAFGKAGLDLAECTDIPLPDRLTVDLEAHEKNAAQAIREVANPRG